MKKLIAIILALAALLSLGACGASPAQTSCCCGGDPSKCTCCGNCCTANAQSTAAVSATAMPASDFDFRLVGSWTLVEEDIQGILGEIKSKNVPADSNIYFSIDGGVSGELFDKIERTLKLSFPGANNVFDPIGRVKTDDGTMDLSALLPEDSGVSIRKVTYSFSDASKGSFKKNTHDALFAAELDDKLHMNISASVDNGILSGDVTLSLIFERIYPCWTYSSDGSKGKYLLMDALEGEWADNYGQSWRFSLDIKGSATATVLNFSVTGADGVTHTGSDFFNTESSDGMSTKLTFVFDNMTVTGTLNSFDGSSLSLTTEAGDELTLTRIG